MKTVKVQSNYGNFATELSAVVGEDLTAATTVLCEQGLLNILYRVSGSYADKALGVDKKSGVSRKDVEYSLTNAEKLKEAVEEKIEELEKGEEGLDGLELEFKVTGEHVFGEAGTSPKARATQFVDMLLEKTETEATLRTTLGVLGLEDADTATREEMIEFAHEKGMGVQKNKKAKAQA